MLVTTLLLEWVCVHVSHNTTLGVSVCACQSQHYSRSEWVCIVVTTLLSRSECVWMFDASSWVVKPYLSVCAWWSRLVYCSHNTTLGVSVCMFDASSWVVNPYSACSAVWPVRDPLLYVPSCLCQRACNDWSRDVAWTNSHGSLSRWLIMQILYLSEVTVFRWTW